MIALIDYGMGNLRSVQKALEAAGGQVTVVRDGGQLTSLHPDKLVLPGVGAFADGIRALASRGFIEPMTAHVRSGRWFLGICLGMQLVFERSQERLHADNETPQGLGWIAGEVVRLREDQGPDRKRLKVPQMGWNALQTRQACPLWRDLPDPAHVYFVHSYVAQPADGSVIAATTDYGQSICAAVQQDNILATQFHPEKSQRTGLAILRHFVQLA